MYIAGSRCLATKSGIRRRFGMVLRHEERVGPQSDGGIKGWLQILGPSRVETLSLNTLRPRGYLYLFPHTRSEWTT